MAEIIDLENDPLFDDCAACQEPSKRVSGTCFDVDGPGRVSVIYDCDNRRCKARQNAIASFVLRRGY